MDALILFIRRSGWRQPIVVSALSGLIVAGHARRIAAIELGCDCPVVHQEFETQTDELAFLLADNRLAELAVIDDDILQSDIDILTNDGWVVGEIGFDFDLG